MRRRPEHETLAALAKKVGRGEQPWRALSAAGASVIRTSDGWEFNGPWIGPVALDAEDIAAGIAAHRDDADGGQEWASFVTSATHFFSLSDDTSIEALWSLSFGMSPELGDNA